MKRPFGLPVKIIRPIYRNRTYQTSVIANEPGERRPEPGEAAAS